MHEPDSRPEQAEPHAKIALRPGLILFASGAGAGAGAGGSWRGWAETSRLAAPETARSLMRRIFPC